MKQNEYANGLVLKVTNILVILILERSLHILYLLKEKKETYHWKTLFSLTRIKRKRLPSKEKLKLVTDNNSGKEENIYRFSSDYYGQFRVMS